MGGHSNAQTISASLYMGGHSNTNDRQDRRVTMSDVEKSGWNAGKKDNKLSLIYGMSQKESRKYQ